MDVTYTYGAVVLRREQMCLRKRLSKNQKKTHIKSLVPLVYTFLQMRLLSLSACLYTIPMILVCMAFVDNRKAASVLTVAMRHTQDCRP